MLYTLLSEEQKRKVNVAIREDIRDDGCTSDYNVIVYFPSRTSEFSCNIFYEDFLGRGRLVNMIELPNSENLFPKGIIEKFAKEIPYMNSCKNDCGGCEEAKLLRIDKVNLNEFREYLSSKGKESDKLKIIQNNSQSLFPLSAG